MITLYDLFLPRIDTLSSNVFKAKYVMGYKGIPYQTIRLEVPDIEEEFKKLGIPPSGTRQGHPLYTCPSIIDNSTDTRLSDSEKIAIYLDKAYPDTPKVFPEGSEALQAAFYHQFNYALIDLFPIILPRIPALLNPRSAEYYTRTRTEDFGKPLADLEPTGEERIKAFNKASAVCDIFDSFYRKSSGPFLMGENPVFVDFAVAGIFLTLQLVLGEDGEEWKAIASWNNRRWSNLLERMEGYLTPTVHSINA